MVVERRNAQRWVACQVGRSRRKPLLQRRAAAGVCLGSTRAASEARDVIAQCPQSEESVVGLRLWLGSAAAGAKQEAGCCEKRLWRRSVLALVLLGSTHAASKARDVNAQCPLTEEAKVPLQ